MFDICCIGSINCGGEGMHEYNTDRHFNLCAYRCIAHVEAQQELGILSQRRAGG